MKWVITAIAWLTASRSSYLNVLSSLLLCVEQGGLLCSCNPWIAPVTLKTALPKSNEAWKYSEQPIWKSQGCICSTSAIQIVNEEDFIHVYRQHLCCTGREYTAAVLNVIKECVQWIIFTDKKHVKTTKCLLVFKVCETFTVKKNWISSFFC